MKDLQRTYEDLERAIDKALGGDVYKGQMDAIHNMEAQIVELNGAIAAEDSKKKPTMTASRIGKTKSTIWKTTLRTCMKALPMTFCRRMPNRSPMNWAMHWPRPFHRARMPHWRLKNRQ